MPHATRTILLWVLFHTSMEHNGADTGTPGLAPHPTYSLIQRPKTAGEHTWPPQEHVRASKTLYLKVVRYCLLVCK